jgi:hypothetical protein
VPIGLDRCESWLNVEEVVIKPTGVVLSLSSLRVSALYGSCEVGCRIKTTECNLLHQPVLSL